MRALRPLPRRPAWAAGRAFACALRHPVAGTINSFTASERANLDQWLALRSAMLILSMPGADSLGNALARELQCPHEAVDAHRFPDGETLVKLPLPVAGEHVVFAAQLDHPDEKVLPLLFAADAARELRARRITLACPYLPYMRQDHRFRDGEAVTSRTFARLLSASFDALFTVDPHLHRWNSLDDIYRLRGTVVRSAPAIANWLAREVDQPLVVGPDSESAQWVADVARRLDAPWTVMTKQRHGDREVQVEMAQGVDWSGRTPVLLDDIISTGHTLMAAARALQAAGLRAPVCVGVHALCDDAAIAGLRAAGVQRVASCDTVPHATNAISVVPLLAQAIARLQPSP